MKKGNEKRFSNCIFFFHPVTRMQSRMETAIHALLRCPQNNLRIFENGNLIYGDHSGSLLLTDLQERGSLFQK